MKLTLQIRMKTYEEHEIADILAVSWREKRQELNKLRQARQFHKEADTRKTYRIEVEELKKRTRCHRCKKIGHWAKERKAPRNNVPKPAASSGSTHAAGCVQAVDTEDFVCAAGWINGPKTLLARVRALRLNAELPTPVQENIEYPVSLVSSPGFAVLDSGLWKNNCGSKHTVRFQKDLERL